MTHNDLIAYAKGLFELNQLIAKGQGDAEEADQIRDQMDLHWLRLSAEETAFSQVLARERNLLKAVANEYFDQATLQKMITRYATKLEEE